MKKLLIAALLLFFSTNFIACSEETIPPDFSLIPVKIDDKWGYINQRGELIIPPIYDEADFFHNGFALVSYGKTKGYIGKDNSFKILLASSTKATAFSEGLAFVVAKGENITCIDTTGAVQFVLNDLNYAEPFSDGLAVVGVFNDSTPVKKGFIDQKGKIVIAPQYRDVEGFSDGMAAFKQGEYWGFINRNGQTIVKPQYTSVESFQEGIAVVRTLNNSALIDKQGKVQLELKNSYIAAFSEGLASVNLKGYINLKGKMVIEGDYYRLEPFHSGRAVIWSATDSKFNYINHRGKELFEDVFQEVTPFYGNIAFVKTEKLWSCIDKKGKYLAQNAFTEVKLDFNKDIIFKSKHK